MRKGFVNPLVFIVLSSIILLVAIAFYINARLSPKPSPQTQSIAQKPPSPTSTAAPTIDEIAGWKIYTNKELGFSIKHPPYFKVDGPQDAPVIYNGVKIITLPGSSIDPYPTSLGFLSRTGFGKSANAKEACEAEICP